MAYMFTFTYDRIIKHLHTLMKKAATNTNSERTLTRNGFQRRTVGDRKNMEFSASLIFNGQAISFQKYGERMCNNSMSNSTQMPIKCKVFFSLWKINTITKENRHVMML
ncbi:hypothetical protein CEXT_439161 [Caerostris extrusa]|uniref:Uncharacterized protein n=1 Tax=Caerostris extrusa TaxID=172846 RepID=A0AAV4N2W6_CAEEX|nr:hypothetical protein CEXT_439161 [Caerostris extrusa]